MPLSFKFLDKLKTQTKVTKKTNEETCVSVLRDRFMWCFDGAL